MNLKRVNLVNRRKELDLTQKQVADFVGVTSRTVQSWELGENIPKLNPLQTSRLCRILECTIDELARYFFPDSFDDAIAAEKPGRYSPK